MLQEASRCPQCADPVCREGCPLGVNIPGFIRYLREGNVSGAYQVIREANSLPSICGRICSAPCQVACVLTDEGAPIAIRGLERYAADKGQKSGGVQVRNCQGKRVAIVGAGPSGLAAGDVLVNLGFRVTIYDILEKPGGVLRYGIPEFRVPKRILNEHVRELERAGIVFKMDMCIGRTFTIKDLLEQGFAAILLATGAGKPRFLDIPGTHLGGVYYGEEFLRRVNREQASRKIPDFFLGPRVVVVGAGNMALDCARSCARFGCEVTCVFPKTEEDMPVLSQERMYAKQEGVTLEPLVKIEKIEGNENDFVTGVTCVRMDYADDPRTGKWQLEPLPDSLFTQEADTVILAIGHNPNTYVVHDENQIKLRRDTHTISVNELTGMTAMTGVFAAGNVVTQAGPLVDAIASGKEVAQRIIRFLQ